MQTAVRRCTLAVRVLRRALGHVSGAEMPQSADAVVGDDGVRLTDVPRCLRRYEEHALSCSMDLVSVMRPRG
jgi:hypothetical protein